MTTGGEAFNLAWASERHLRVVFADPDAAARVAGAYAALRDAGVRGITDLTPASTTLLVHLDPRADPGSVEGAVRSLLVGARPHGAATASREVNVPACYGGDMGPDLPDLCRRSGLTEAEAVRLHSGPAYTVRFIGFSPGFPYLTGLPLPLAMPRLDEPRTLVPAGSIAIAGDQAGIYPRATAGGWRIVGRTPLALFDPALPDPVLLRPGDRVRFRPISIEEFSALAGVRGGRTG